MKHHLHLLLAASFAAISIGAAAAVHDWTATRIGSFEPTPSRWWTSTTPARWRVVHRGRGRAPARLPLHPRQLGRACRSRLLRRYQNGAQRRSTRAARWWGGRETADGALEHAFVYRDGRMQRLGLPGERPGRLMTSTIAARSSCAPRCGLRLSRRHLPSGRPPHRSERPRALFTVTAASTIAARSSVIDHTRQPPPRPRLLLRQRADDRHRHAQWRETRHGRHERIGPDRR